MEEKLKKVCECFLKGELTTKVLKDDCGIYGYSLNKLIEENFLIKIGRGKYKINDLYYLQSYALDIIQNNPSEREKIYNIFKKSIEINPEFAPAYFQIMMNKLYEDKIEEAYKYFNELREHTPITSKYTKDYYIYNLLFGYLTTLNAADFDTVKNLKLEDVLPTIDDNRFSDKVKDSELREHLLANRFGVALKIIDDKKNMNESSIFYSTIKLLLVNILKSIRTLEKDLNEMVKLNEYEKAYNYLKEQKKTHLLCNRELMAIRLLTKIKDMLITRTIPEVRIIDGNNRYDYMLANDFTNALNEYNIHDYYEKLLKASLNIIERIKNNEENLIPNININHNRKVPNLTPLNKIYSLLQNGETNKALEKVLKYLKSINQEEYFYIITLMIKIAIAENDKTFKDVFEMLDNISKEDYTFVIDPFVNGFFTAGREGNITVAKMYQDIIRNAKPFNKAYVIADDLTDTLTYYTNRAIEKNDEIIFDENDNEEEITFNGYNLDNASEIMELLINNVEFDDIIKRFNISEDKIPYLYLLSAELYYYLKLYEIGDYYVKLVNDSHNDNIDLLQAEREVLTNRNKYSLININSYRLTRTNK